jgi:hypothetical protein
MIGKDDHRDQQVLLVYHLDELRGDAVSFSGNSLPTRNPLDNHIFSILPACQGFRRRRSQKRLLYATFHHRHTIYLHRFSHNYIPCPERDGRGKSFRMTCNFLPAQTERSYIPIRILVIYCIMSRPCYQRVMYTPGSFIMNTTVMHVKDLEANYV